MLVDARRDHRVELDESQEMAGRAVGAHRALPDARLAGLGPGDVEHVVDIDATPVGLVQYAHHSLPAVSRPSF
jgi:hypothetical protein